MQNFDKDLIITIAILSVMMYLFHRSLFKFKKLTNYQQQNRLRIMNKNGFILAFILAFAYGFDYVSKNYLYQFFINVTQKSITLNMFVGYGFGLITLVLFLINLKINSLINKKDEREVSISQEATFVKFQPKPREVKPIRFYSHFFNGISVERSAKDYTIQSVKLNIDLADIQKYKTEQEEKTVKINNFYKRLIDYINLKASLFNYSKIEHFELQEFL